MKVLAKTNNMGREEWLRWRRMGIGGSDAAVCEAQDIQYVLFHAGACEYSQKEPVKARVHGAAD